MVAQSKCGLIAVCWIGLGSCDVHQVSEGLVDYVGDKKVIVWWPSCTKGKRWDGELVLYMYLCVYAYPYVDLYLYHSPH